VRYAGLAAALVTVTVWDWIQRPGTTAQRRFSRSRTGQNPCMPRALWSGAITFGLVNVPVRLYSAISEHKLQFHFVHEKDDSPIGYQKICKREDKPVPDKEIVKAFEYRKGKNVYMEDEDFAAARVEGYKTIDITDFVPYEQIDPIFFAHTYLVGPQEGAEKVYSLLVRAMEDTELAGIAKFVMRDRQYLGALRVRDGVITLEQLHFADEIRPVDEIKPKRERVAKQELEMAEQLIDRFSSEWKPEKYKDTYREALMSVIEAKRKGKEVHVAAQPEEEEPADLMAALRESLESAKGGRRPARSTSSSNGASAEGLKELSKSELDERARKAKIEGRSKMSKDELIEALRTAA
jgi:DNA end-binding protein Ku